MWSLKEIICLIKLETLCAKADEETQVGWQTDPARQETTADEDQIAEATIEVWRILKP